VNLRRFRRITRSGDAEIGGTRETGGRSLALPPSEDPIMKKTVLTFGLIAGAIVSLFMVLALAFKDAIGFDRGEIVGYTSMVVAFLFIYFGVRAYRDNVGGGTVSFGRGVAVGSLIAVLASVCYVATWEVIYYNFTPDYIEKYREHAISKARADGESAAAIAEKTAKMDRLVRIGC
jgi:hypothetical protein